MFCEAGRRFAAAGGGFVRLAILKKRCSILKIVRTFFAAAGGKDSPA
jgi:hypothetical protein